MARSMMRYPNMNKKPNNKEERISTLMISLTKLKMRGWTILSNSPTL